MALDQIVIVQPDMIPCHKTSIQQVGVPVPRNEGEGGKQMFTQASPLSDCTCCSPPAGCHREVFPLK